jgi:copper(I)-binding protein
MFHAVVRRRPVAVSVAATAAAVVLGIAGCGSAEPATKSDPSPSPSATVAAATPLTVQDPWVKAADEGMTAAFATLVNTSGGDITVVGATAEISPVELHTMIHVDGKMVMTELEGGLLIKAGESHVLEPGGDHLMLMELSRPIRAGEEVTITLNLSDGGRVDFTAVAKPFTGAEESYAPGHGEPEVDHSEPR